MYTAHFRLKQPPFSIAPDPRYLFMSERHREALAHLLYGIDAGGGIVLLTGEIGTGKTTLCRCLLEQIPPTCNIAYVFNPKLTVTELLESICAEFHIALPAHERRSGTRAWTDALNRYLLAQHACGRSNVLVIDEAQNLAPDVLEQLRLLTNLETNERKLLQIILIGQPELRTMLAQPKLEQLAQRVIAHYHLGPLNEQETAAYVQHRLTTAGLNGPSPFAPAVIRHIHRLSAGVPRRINLLCDRALLGAYAQGLHHADRRTVEHAASELFISHGTRAGPQRWPLWPRVAAGAAGLLLVGAGAAAVGLRVFDAQAPLAVLPAPAAATEAAAPVPASVPAVSAAGGSNASDAPAPTLIAARGTSPVAAPEFGGIADEAQALRELAQLWGWNEGSAPLCANRSGGLLCYRSKGGLAELRQLDRPALLKLYDHANQPYYALVVQLGEGRARLQAGSAHQDVTLADLTRHFRGEFTTLWRTVTGSGENLVLGQQSPTVDWVGEQLARVHGTEVPPQRQPYNLELHRQVRLFQQAHGLTVDGVVGPRTYMHLNRVAEVNEPRLLAAAGD